MVALYILLCRLLKFWNNYKLQEVAKIVQRVQRILHPASPSDILHKCSIVSKVGNWHLYNTANYILPCSEFTVLLAHTHTHLCVIPCNLIPCIDLCNHHHNLYTELFHYTNSSVEILYCLPLHYHLPHHLPHPYPLATTNLFSFYLSAIMRIIYSWFMLFMVVMFHKVTANTKLANIKSFLLERI